MRRVFCGVIVAIAAAVSAAGQTTQSWLDRPMAGWHRPGAAIPSPPSGTEPREALLRRCGTPGAKASAAASQALGNAGWVPFLHLDRQLQRDDVEVLGGMSAASPGCEPTTFNLFVFAGGAFAGTLSPVPMTPARDGVVGAVRVAASDSLSAEFARYTPADAECCPSSRVRVSYRIDRAGVRTVVVATEARQIR
jgi:hypothetical protein